MDLIKTVIYCVLVICVTALEGNANNSVKDSMNGVPDSPSCRFRFDAPAIRFENDTQKSITKGNDSKGIMINQSSPVLDYSFYFTLRSKIHFDKDLTYEKDYPTIHDFGIRLGFGYKINRNLYIHPEIGYREYDFNHDPGQSTYNSKFITTTINLGYIKELNWQSWNRNPFLNSYCFYRYDKEGSKNTSNGSNFNYNLANFRLGISSGLAFKLFSQTLVSTNLVLQYIRYPDSWDLQNVASHDRQFLFNPEIFLIIGIPKKQ